MINSTLDAIVLDYRIKLEGMLAENSRRLDRDEALAYGEDSFDSLRSDFNEELQIAREAYLKSKK